MHSLSKFLPKSSGASVLEIVVGVSIVSVAIFAMVLVVARSLAVARDNLERAQAAFLLEEGVEALRVMRDRNWKSLALLPKGTTEYFYYDGLTWRATTSASKIDNLFTRTFVLSSVSRDSNDRIASGGTLDPKTLAASSSVSWVGTPGATSTLSAKTYITNIFNE